MSGRKTKLVDCNPRWGSDAGANDCWITFDCPEGHAGCAHTIPFTPALDGTPQPRDGYAQWERTGDTFETLTLSPSIARRPKYADRAAAILAGCIPEYVTESFLCALHIEVINGEIRFSEDSR